MTETTEDKIVWKNIRDEYLYRMGQYTERFINRCTYYVPDIQDGAFHFNKLHYMNVQYEGLNHSPEVLFKYFERHAYSLGRGVELDWDNGKSMNLRILPRPVLKEVNGHGTV